MEEFDQLLDEFAKWDPTPALRFDQELILESYNSIAQELFDDYFEPYLFYLFPDIDKKKFLNWVTNSKIKIFFYHETFLKNNFYEFIFIKVPENYTHAYGSEITNFKIKEQHLRRQARFTEENPSPILSFNDDGLILSANLAAKEILNFYSTNNLYLDKILPGFADLNIDLQNLIKKAEVFEFETKIDNDYFLFTIKGVPSDWRIGHIYGSNITLMKKMELMKQDTERVVKHDIKNPLTGILGFVQLLLDAPNIKDDQVYWLSMIQDNCNQILNMIDHSLDLFKMEEGNYTIKPSQIDLIKLFDNLQHEFDKLLSNSNVKMLFFINNKPIIWEDKYNIMGEYYYPI